MPPITETIYNERDRLTSDTHAAIESALEHPKMLRFSFERQENLSALQALKDALLNELDLLDSTKWGVRQKQVNDIFSKSKTIQGEGETDC